MLDSLYPGETAHQSEKEIAVIKEIPPCGFGNEVPFLLD